MKSGVSLKYIFRRSAGHQPLRISLSLTLAEFFMKSVALFTWWGVVINLLGVRSTRPGERDNSTIVYNLHTFISSLQHSLINTAKVGRYQGESEPVIGVRKSNQWSLVSILFQISSVEVHKYWLSIDLYECWIANCWIVRKTLKIAHRSINQ